MKNSFPTVKFEGDDNEELLKLKDMENKLTIIDCANVKKDSNCFDKF